MVFSGNVSRLIKPEGVLPFKLSQKEAFDNFRRWIRKLWFAPAKLKQYAQAESKLAGVYIPFWTYDSITTTPYSGNRGDYYTPRSSTARWKMAVLSFAPARCGTPAGLPSAELWGTVLTTSASPQADHCPGNATDLFAPWDLEHMVPYDDAFLSGFRAESYRVTLPEGYEVAKRMMAPVIEGSIRRDIGGDEQRIHSAETQICKYHFQAHPPSSLDECLQVPRQNLPDTD